jgi:hypothetical protein
MIGVRVGHHGTIDRLPGIDVKIAGRAVQAGIGGFEQHSPECRAGHEPARRQY